MSRLKTGWFWMWFGFGASAAVTAACLLLAAISPHQAFAAVGIAAAVVSGVMAVILQLRGPRP